MRRVVPYLDLKAQYRSIKSEIDKAVAGVLESGQFVLGPEVAAFEREFASYVGAAEAVAVSSGTSALHLALVAAGIGPGDEVITVSSTFVATVSAVVYTGARPVLVDIDPVTCTLDPQQVERVITPRTKAILPVHLYGRPAHLDTLTAIARRFGLLLIEDAAQAHGAEFRNRRVGSVGDMGCFSFYPGKNLGAFGEGGAVVTNRPDFAQKLRMLRDWGQDRRYHHLLRGFNYRMEGLQGAILRVKLAHLDVWTERRRALATLYDRLLADAPVGIPASSTECRHVYHVYALRTADRDGLRARLQADGIDTGIHYPIPVHLQPAFESLGYHEGTFPHTERLADEELSLPLYPEMTEADVEYVASAVARHVAAEAVR
jgi:dTDP-4-amino-4,6-dideoxygalactose transaminase